MVATSPVWTSGRDLLFSAGSVYRMWLYRASTSANAKPPVSTLALTNGGLTFDRKSRRLAYTSGQFIDNLFRIPTSGGDISQVPERLTSTSGVDLMPRFSPDGNTVAFGSIRFGTSSIWTTQIRPVLSSELISSRYATLVPGDWTPDGKSLLVFATTEEGRW
jgi:Tol biopolymer transport system component